MLTNTTLNGHFMIKLVFCLHRLPALTREQFQSYWRDTHAPLVQRHAAVLGIQRYTQSHTANVPALQPALDARGAEVDEYDGVAELWFNPTDPAAAKRDPMDVANAAQELLEDERRFIDLPRSPIFVSHEHVILDDM